MSRLEKLEQERRVKGCGWLAEGSLEGQTQVYSCAAMEFGNSHRAAEDWDDSLLK